MTEPIAELRYYIHNTKNIELQIVAMNGIINFARKITKDYTGQYVINVETQLKMIDMNGPISHEVNEMIIQELFYINHKSRK